MSKKSVQRSITMTQEMRDRLALLVSKQPRDTTEADIRGDHFHQPAIRHAERRLLHEEDASEHRRLGDAPRRT